MRLNWKLPKIFYGWWIVGACFLISLYTGGAVVFGFTAFFEPIANEFGWSYTQVSLAASIRGMELGLLAPIAGLLVDRWGPRRLMLVGIIITSLGLLVVSRTTSLGIFYGGFALVSLGVSCFGATVMFTAVANWFKRKIGIASGIMACGISLGALLIPLIVRLINVFNWHTTMVILAIGTLVIGMPLSLIVRHKPEQYGYLPDGEQRNTATLYESIPPAPTVEVDIGAKQALKSRAFWHVAVLMAFQFFGISAVMTHIMPYLSSVGITRSTSSLVATAFPSMSIGGRLGFGWLSDRFDKRWIAAVDIATIGFGLLFLGHVSIKGMWLLLPFIIFCSSGYGGGIVMGVALVREYFGRSKFGTINGLVMGIAALGTVTGPLFAGWIFDNWGSYYAAWLVFASIAFVGVIIIVTAPPTGTKS